MSRQQFPLLQNALTVSKMSHSTSKVHQTGLVYSQEIKSISWLRLSPEQRQSNTRRLGILKRSHPPGRNWRIQGADHHTQDLLLYLASVQYATTMASQKQSMLWMYVAINWILRIRSILGYDRNTPENIIVQCICITTEMELEGTQQVGTEISHAATQGKKERAPRNEVKSRIVWESQKICLGVHSLCDVSMSAINIMQWESHPRRCNSQSSYISTSHHWESLTICSLVFCKTKFLRITSINLHYFSLQVFCIKITQTAQ